MAPWKRIISCSLLTTTSTTTNLLLFAKALSTRSSGGGGGGGGGFPSNKGQQQQRERFGGGGKFNGARRRKSTTTTTGNNNNNNNNGRQRKKNDVVGNRKRHQKRKQQQKGSSSSLSSKNHLEFQEDHLPAPPLTTNVPQSLLPSYFSCRHTYEDTLIEEIQRSLSKTTAEVEESSSSSSSSLCTIASPFPGLVCVTPNKNNISHNTNVSLSLPQLLYDFDPIYALQMLPKCNIIQAESIKQLAVAAMACLGLVTDDDNDNDNDDTLSLQQEELRNAPRGSLSIHALVPGMFKGQKDPMLQRRAYKVGEQISTMLQKSYPCARRRRDGTTTTATTTATTNNNNNNNDNDDEKWVLQILLFTPEIMGVSLAKCHQTVAVVVGGGGSVAEARRSSIDDNGVSTTSPPLVGMTTWPNWYYPAGLTNVDIERDETSMPSSAYRKLLEALNCIHKLPPSPLSTFSNDDDARHVDKDEPSPAVIDLGACPGGWTKALRLLNCKVIAVDRSELRSDLMDDDMVRFVKADAFTYEPPPQRQLSCKNNNNSNTWMVSDVIAYPERVQQLLESWCGKKWATNMIVTVKFQGETIAWDALQKAMDVAIHYGYYCRAKHFFNNKNEVTLMLVYSGEMMEQENKKVLQDRIDASSILGRPMYPTVL